MPPDTDPTDEQRARAVKFSGRDTIEGPVFLFGYRDVDGEQFTAETDFCLDWFGKSRPVLYEHGLDHEMKRSVIGHQTDYEIRPEGIWQQTELKRHAAYRQMVDPLIEAGILGYSGGAMQHLAQKNKSGAITVFPWVESSLTPTPAAPGNLGIHYVKSASLLQSLENDDTQLSIAAVKAIAAGLSEAEPVPALIDEKAGRVSAAVAEFRNHAREAAEMRIKSGRVLSSVNRERIAKALASKEAVLAAYADLESLLTETDPSQKSTGDLFAIEWAKAQERERKYPIA